MTSLLLTAQTLRKFKLCHLHLNEALAISWDSELQVKLQTTLLNMYHFK